MKCKKSPKMRRTTKIRVSHTDIENFHMNEYPIPQLWKDLCECQIKRK